MAQFFLLNDKVEAALEVIVRQAVTAVQVVTGKSAAVKMVPPVIICAAEADGQEDPFRSGNFFVNGSVAIKTLAVPDEDGVESSKSNAQSSADLEAAVKSDSQDLVASVFGAVCVADLAEQLTAAVPDLTVFPGSVQFGAPESGRDAKGIWNDVIHFRCYACGSRLS